MGLKGRTEKSEKRKGEKKLQKFNKESKTRLIKI